MDEAYQITPDEIIAALGGLPDFKLHCSVLGADAVRKSIDDYRSKSLPSNNIDFAPLPTNLTILYQDSRDSRLDYRSRQQKQGQREGNDQHGNKEIAPC